MLTVLPLFIYYKAIIIIIPIRFHHTSTLRGGDGIDVLQHLTTDVQHQQQNTPQLPYLMSKIASSLPPPPPPHTHTHRLSE